MYWLKLPLALATISLAHLVAAQGFDPCTAFLSDVVPKDDGSLEFIILSAPNEDGSYCEGELIGSGSTEATFIMTPNGGGDGDAFSYILPADKVPTGSVEWRVRTSAGDTNYIFYPPFDPNPPPYQCEIEITGVNTVPGDGLGGYIKIEGTAPAGCNPLKVNIYGADEDNAVSEEGTALSSASEAWSYQSNADFAPGGYTIVVSALNPDDSNYLPGALEEPYSYNIAEQERGCLSAPEIIDSSCQQGYPSSLSMTIAVTTGNKECVITVTKDNDDLYTFVFAPESDGSQTIGIPSQYMGSTIAGYNVYNDQGEAPRDVICPYSRLPVRCKIGVTGVRSVKGPGGGFFASVDASAQSGCGPYNYYIHNDDDADFGETDDLPFQSDKELSPGSYTITLSNNPQDPDEYLYADVVDFSFTLGGPESSLRRRRTGCASGEDLCFDPDGIARCYADLDSNLARCGGCNGPDCTRLPHVEGAHCHLGQCIVDLCSRGFHLQDNACAPGFADEDAVGRLFVQA